MDYSYLCGMKYPYVFLFILIFLLSCQSKDSKEVVAAAQNSETFVDESSYDNGSDGLTWWTTEEYIDEFGDPTGEQYLHFNCTGNFSNIASENKPLSVEIFVDKDEVYFKIYTYESKQLVKNRGLLFADVKFDNEKKISFALNNQGLGKTSIVKSSANPKQLRDIFLIDGPIKFHITNDKMRPTSEYNFIYDGQASDFEQCMQDLGILFD